MLAVCVIALLCLVSVSHSAPLVCEDLVRPLDQLHHLEGRWFLVAGSMNNTAYVERFKHRDTASITFVNETSKMSFTRIFGFNDSCQYLNVNITLEGSGFTFHPYNLTVTFLHTSCPDCVVLRFDKESKQIPRVYLFSKRRELEHKEMEDFKAQLECFNLPPPILMDPNKEPCPEHISKDSAPLACEDLIRPLDHPPHHLEGMWSVVAGSLNDTAHEEEFKRRNSTSANFVNETSHMSFTLMTRIGDSCKYVNENITLEGSHFTLHHFNVRVTLLHTSCPDCLLMYSDNESKTNIRLYLFSKRRELKHQEMEDFMAVVGCLHMPPPVLMDPKMELCPEQMPKDPAAQTKKEAGGPEA